MTQRVSDERLATLLAHKDDGGANWTWPDVLMDLRDARAALAKCEDEVRNLVMTRLALLDMRDERDQWKKSCENMLPAETQRHLEHERDALKGEVARLKAERDGYRTGPGREPHDGRSDDRG